MSMRIGKELFQESCEHAKMGDQMEGEGPTKYMSFLRNNARTVVDYIDDGAKIGFPVLYLLFNGVYWTSYLYYIPDEINDLWIGPHMYNMTHEAYVEANLTS